MPNPKSKKLTLAQIGEFGLIEKIKRVAYQNKAVVKGIGDDTAVLPGEKGNLLLMTTDMLTEGVHFTRKASPQAIGHKALACNISDILAMGGIPTYAVISLAAPASLKADFVQKIYQGINALARKFKISIVGGDTVRHNKIIINVTLLGKVKKKDLVTRDGAKEGDQIFVTGGLGRSLKSGKHLNFTPKLTEAKYLIKHFHPTAMIDISDGLVADLNHILKESNVSAQLYKENIPKNPGVSLNEALYGGEDFELLFTLSHHEAHRLTFMRMKLKKFYFYHIGKIVDRKRKLQLVDRKGRKTDVLVKGFRHF